MLLVSSETISQPCPHLFKMAEEGDWPPFTVETQGVATKGLSYDMMKLIFKKLGCEVEVHLFPQARMLKLVEDGTRDGVTAISKNREREQYLHYLNNPLLTRKSYIYSLKNRKKPLEFTGWESLRGLRLGIVRGYNYPKDFYHAVDNVPINITEVKDTAQLFQLLVLRRIDAFPSMELIADEFLKDKKYNELIKKSSKNYAESKYYLAISKKSKLINYAQSLDSIIHSLIVDGSIGELLKKHGAGSN